MCTAFKNPRSNSKIHWNLDFKLKERRNEILRGSKGLSLSKLDTLFNIKTVITHWTIFYAIKALGVVSVNGDSSVF